MESSISGYCSAACFLTTFILSPLLNKSRLLAQVVCFAPCFTPGSDQLKFDTSDLSLGINAKFPRFSHSI